MATNASTHRPRSSKSPVSTQPQGPGASTTHKRTKSTPRASLSPSLITLYTTNLRLLNLDLLPDWPQITPTTFSAADARARIKASEWSLYQLFRLYDRSLTVEKLQPFFPPLEPLQSINLRAALFRCLEGVRKTGVLGREAVLRKSMLDECSGDKFWEVCLAFSAVVLRDVLLQGRRESVPVAQRIGVKTALGRGEREMLAPLVLAHKVKLGKAVEERRRLREGFERLEGVLGEKSEELGRRAAVERERKSAQMSGKAMGQLNALHDTVRKSWVGDEALKDAVVSGASVSAGDFVLLQSTNSFLEQATCDAVRQDGQGEKGVLEDIEFKARSQNARMKRWQSMYDKLQATRAARPAHTRSATVASGASGLRFDQHHDLNLDELPPQTAGQPSASPTKASYINRYDAILTAMREDLRRANGTRRSATAPVSQHPRKPSMTIDVVAGAPERCSQHTHSPSAQRSPSQQTAPFRPGRMSSRSRSYQQPKVISQRGPIPLKSELFSPLKTSRRGSQSPASTASSRPTSMLVSPREEDGYQVTSMHDAHDALSSKRGSQSSDAKADSAVGLGMGPETASPMELDPSYKQLHQDQPFPLDFTAKKPDLPPPRPSLAERTRMSMAFTSSEDIRKPQPTTSKLSPTTNTTPDSNPTAPAPQTLADRTRQSISSHHPLPSRKSHTRTRSSIVHPVNPFATPPAAVARPRRSSFGTHDEGEGERTPRAVGRRDLTPREKLFEASAEYDSVFKARPRVCVSPSPERKFGERGEGEGSPLGDGR